MAATPPAEGTRKKRARSPSRMGGPAKRRRQQTRCSRGAAAAAGAPPQGEDEKQEGRGRRRRRGPSEAPEGGTPRACLRQPGGEPMGGAGAQSLRRGRHGLELERQIKRVRENPLICPLDDDDGQDSSAGAGPSRPNEGIPGAPTILFRALREGEDPKGGLWPIAPQAQCTPEVHVLGRTRETPYISLTANPEVALYYAACRGGQLRQRVVRIDGRMLQKARMVDLQGEGACRAAGLGPEAMCLTANDEEILYRGRIPACAISAPDPAMGRCETLRMCWGEGSSGGARRTPNVQLKLAFRRLMPIVTRERLRRWGAGCIGTAVATMSPGGHRPRAKRGREADQLEEKPLMESRSTLTGDGGGTMPRPPVLDIKAHGPRTSQGGRSLMGPATPRNSGLATRGLWATK